MIMDHYRPDGLTGPVEALAYMCMFHFLCLRAHLFPPEPAWLKEDQTFEKSPSQRRLNMGTAEAEALEALARIAQRISYELISRIRHILTCISHPHLSDQHTRQL